VRASVLRATEAGRASWPCSDTVLQCLLYYCDMRGPAGASPYEGPEVFAPAAVWSSACRDLSAAPAGHPRVGARATVTADTCQRPGKLTTVCGRLWR